MGEEHYVSRKFYRKKRVLEIEKKINLLGVSSNLDVYTFLNIQTIGAFVMFFIGLFIKRFGFIFGPLFSIVYYYGINYFLIDKRISIRQRKIEDEALSFFEILTLSLETGRNLHEAISVSVDSLDGILVSEFRAALRDVKFGHSLTEAIKNMTRSIPSDTVNNILITLTDANLYGGSIIDSLYTQLDYLREKRKDLIKEEISKVPIKISIISVLFFIPLILLIILGPVLLSYFGS